MFDDLDRTLEALLTDPGVPAALVNAEVLFEPPDRAFHPAQAAVNLFLYEVKENRELRDPQPIVARVADLYTHRRPPLRVDCAYMVTAWSAPGTGAAAQTAQEHRVLGAALAWLSRFDVVPGAHLRGALVNPDFPPVPLGVGQADGGKSAAEFWTALGVAPRASFTLVATVALDLALAFSAPPVTTILAGLRQDDDAATREELVTIGGVVRTAAGAAVARAWVRLEPQGAVARTDAQGRFVFGSVGAGPGYTLRARAAGLGETTAAITVPSTSGDYIVQFP